MGAAEDGRAPTEECCVSDGGSVRRGRPRTAAPTEACYVLAMAVLFEGGGRGLPRSD
jgi:hypothetical protein